jgi:hypothetical protein
MGVGMCPESSCHATRQVLGSVRPTGGSQIERAQRCDRALGVDGEEAVAGRLLVG